jgi:dTDP-glucose 4,6-dehydratase
MNIIGERQHSEKFIPLCIKKILNDEIIQVHSNENLTKSGTRFYLHARNIAKALQFILEKTDEKLNKIDASLGCWNVVGDKEIENSELAKIIGSIIGKDIKMEMINFHSSRPGHDLRYALSGEKLKKAGFNYPKSFMDTLKKTVEWYLKTENKKWLNI